METFTMRTCSTCGNILTFININSLGYSICWNCKTKALIDVNFTQEMLEDERDFNNVQEVWNKRSDMIKYYELIDFVERFEEIPVETVKRFLEQTKSRVMWQTEYRKPDME